MLRMPRKLGSSGSAVGAASSTSCHCKGFYVKDKLLISAVFILKKVCIEIKAVQAPVEHVTVLSYLGQGWPTAWLGTIIYQQLSAIHGVHHPNLHMLRSIELLDNSDTCPQTLKGGILFICRHANYFWPQCLVEPAAEKPIYKQGNMG